MRAVELTPAKWDAGVSAKTAQDAVPEKPLQDGCQALKAQLSVSDCILSIDIESFSAATPNGEQWTIGLADLVDGWIEEAGTDRKGLAELDCLAVHLEEQAARLWAILARHGLAGRSISISGRRVPHRANLANIPVVPLR